jgi:Ribbon-helix-helix protein, copG family
MTATVAKLVELMAGKLKLDTSGRNNRVEMRRDRRRQSPASPCVLCTSTTLQMRPCIRTGKITRSAGHVTTMVGVRDRSSVDQHRVGPAQPVTAKPFMRYTNHMPKSSTKKRIGRPPTGHDPNFSIRLPKQLIAAIDKIAKETNGNRAETIRLLLAEAVAARRKS